MSTAASSHPSPEQLTAFRLKQLKPAEAQEITLHLEGCAQCRQAIESFATSELTHPDAATCAYAPPPAGGGTIPPELLDHPRYRVLEVLGSGGMGTVYRAEHRVMERLVALKVIRPHLTQDPAVCERFRREVKAAGRLQHPNIVTAHDADQAGELHFLVMEYVEGSSLDRVLATRGPLPVAQACDWVRQAALGLQHAFTRDMVHRDIKPHNLMLTAEGQVKILDFGLARVASELQSAGALTAPGLLMGTPDYIAPEQANDSHSADIRADIYSLGCTLYHLLTGQPPFPSGTALEKILSHLHREPIPVTQLRRDLPPELGMVVQRMLVKDPDQRYQTPAEVVEALTDFIEREHAPQPDTELLSGFQVAPQPPSERWFRPDSTNLGPINLLRWGCIALGRVFRWGWLLLSQPLRWGWIMLEQAATRNPACYPPAENIPNSETRTQLSKPPRSSAATLGQVSLIVGLIALVISWVPCLGLVGLPVGVIGLLLGGGGFLTGWLRRERLSRLAVSGSIISTLAISLAVAVTWYLPNIFGSILSSWGGPLVNFSPNLNVNVQQPASSFTDASRGHVQLGEVRVRVTEVAVDVLPILKEKLPLALPRGKLPGDLLSKKLLIRVRLENTSATQTVNYQSWGSGIPVTLFPPTLKDQTGKVYQRWAPPLPIRFRGQLPQAAIAPGATVEDLLVFETLPGDEVRALYLELPGLAFAQTGAVQFEIPRSMWAGAKKE